MLSNVVVIVGIFRGGNPVELEANSCFKCFFHLLCLRLKYTLRALGGEYTLAKRGKVGVLVMRQSSQSFWSVIWWTILGDETATWYARSYVYVRNWKEEEEEDDDDEEEDKKTKWWMMNWCKRSCDIWWTDSFLCLINVVQDRLFCSINPPGTLAATNTINNERSQSSKHLALDLSQET